MLTNIVCYCNCYKPELSLALLHLGFFSLLHNYSTNAVDCLNTDCICKLSNYEVCIIWGTLVLGWGILEYRGIIKYGNILSSCFSHEGIIEVGVGQPSSIFHYQVNYKMQSALCIQEPCLKCLVSTLPSEASSSLIVVKIKTQLN